MEPILRNHKVKNYNIHDSFFDYLINTQQKNSTGPTGPSGSIGSTGSAGPAGNGGSLGVAGSQGPIGYVGNPGPTGANGIIGNPGPTGATGIITDLNSSTFWDNTIQPYLINNTFQTIILGNGPVGPGLPNWIITGGTDLSSTTTGWYMCTYTMNYFLGNSSTTFSNFIAMRLVLAGVQVPGSGTLCKGPADSNDHEYVMTRTILFSYSVPNSILNLQCIAEYASSVGITPPAGGDWATFISSNAQVVITRVGDI